MRLTFLGKDSQPNQSPTIYATDRDSYVVQGWIVTDPEILGTVTTSDADTIVEVPARLMTYLAKDGLNGTVTDIAPPILHVTTEGHYVLEGKRVSDPEVLEQMEIPGHETCVEVPRRVMVKLLSEER